jgi:menaquinone-dependent protoporphyrinogen oxidase
MELFYATRDGQSRRIAERIARRLADSGIPAVSIDLAGGMPASSSLATARLVVVVAAVRYGRPLPEAEQFLAFYRTLRERPRLVLLSVNLTARKPGKDTVEGNAYLRKSIARHGLEPAFALAIAGRLDYSRYRWLDRQLIRFIMKLTGGPTDPKTCIEFTPWDVVDNVALRIAALHGLIYRRVGPSESEGAVNFGAFDPGQPGLDRQRLNDGRPIAGESARTGNP